MLSKGNSNRIWQIKKETMDELVSQQYFNLIHVYIYYIKIITMKKCDLLTVLQQT